MAKTTTTTTTAPQGYYGNFKGWQAKTFGPVPTTAQLLQAHLHCKAGTQVALATALMLRPQGATQPQVQAVLALVFGSAQRTQAKAGGWVKVGMAHWRAMPAHGGAHVYALAFNASANKPALVGKRAAKAAAPTTPKAKAARKPRAPKAAAPTTPATPATPATGNAA